MTEREDWQDFLKIFNSWIKKIYTEQDNKKVFEYVRIIQSIPFGSYCTLCDDMTNYTIQSDMFPKWELLTEECWKNVPINKFAQYRMIYL